MKSFQNRKDVFARVSGTSMAAASGGRNSEERPAFVAADNLSSLDEVISALRESGLESLNLILGFDFSKCNDLTGSHSFRRKSLHAIGALPNPYEQAISIIVRTLSSFDEDNLINCFGFGDESTRDQFAFSFNSDYCPCHGFEEVLSRYKELAPHICLSDPTSFAPVIRASIDIVKRSNWQYHVLVIIAGSQVTRNPDIPEVALSPQEHASIDAIVEASHFPLSIIVVGVGDGPWDGMHRFVGCIPERAFDNFQFINFTEIMPHDAQMAKKEAAFAQAALMEVPFQYRAAQGLPRTEIQAEGLNNPLVLTTPPTAILHGNAEKASLPSRSTQSCSSDFPEEKVCPICLTNAKDMAFGCGHLTCKECGPTLSLCPLCRAPIKTRLRLYDS